MTANLEYGIGYKYLQWSVFCRKVKLLFQGSSQPPIQRAYRFYCNPLLYRRDHTIYVEVCPRHSHLDTTIGLTTVVSPTRSTIHCMRLSLVIWIVHCWVERALIREGTPWLISKPLSASNHWSGTRSTAKVQSPRKRTSANQSCSAAVPVKDSRFEYSTLLYCMQTWLAEMLS